jgi:Dolichyl-phosphate-mannose-protein mannosyltransferase
MTSQPPAPRRLFAVKFIFPLALALIFGLGLGVRFFDLSAPLLDFHPTRQLFAALRARGMYYQTLPNAPTWQKDLSTRQMENLATIEPPIMDHIAVFFYGYFGEQTAIPRAFSVVFWSVGGIFLFLLACNLTGSSPGAAAALAFYMFLPYAVRASRAFQPDPLMVMLITMFWWAVENWGRKPASWKWTLLAGLGGGLAILVKFPAAFFVIGGGLGAIAAHADFRKVSKLPQTWSMALLGVLPAGIYLYYGLYVTRFLSQQFEDRFYPELLLTSAFYLRWFLRVNLVASALWLALALLGWLLFANRPLRMFLLALFVAYFVYGLVFDYHISSHDYYSLPLIPILALALAPLAADIMARLREKIQASGSAMTLAVVTLLFTFIALTAERYLDLRTNDYRPQAALWAEIGAAIGHQPGVIAVTTDYGYPLQYYGWQNADVWPLAPDITNFDKVFTRAATYKSYFLVTDFDEFDRQPELKQRLYENYPILAQGRGYIVFDLLHPLESVNR